MENESTLRFLRKAHKDWPEEKIKLEAIKIWNRYIEANKEKLEEDAIKKKKQWEEYLDKEYAFFDPND